MRHWLVRATAAAVLVGGASFAFAYSTGPPVTRTNGFAVADKPAESNCTLCHMPTGAVNADPNGSVSIVGVPLSYVPSGIYNLEVHLNYDWSKDPFGGTTPRKWGFQFTAINAASGDSSGLFISRNVPPDSLQLMRYPPLSLSKFKARVYIEHTIADYHLGENQDGQSGPIVWHFKWVAPAGDSGKVYFFVAGNAANGDSCSVCGGDHIYSSVDSTVANPDLAGFDPPHPGHFITSFERPYPNPMARCTNFQFEIAQGGLVDLSIFDLQGRKVRTIVHEHLEASSYGEFWDGTNEARVQARNGVYFVRLVAPGLAKPISYRLVLAR
ncbi:MAG: choice-of-anchor V domain-containing protein [Candidatus Eiseniibacteriota bacterium]